MTEQQDVWQFKCGVSLHCLSRAVTPEEFDLLGKSVVETLELYPPMLAEDRILSHKIHNRLQMSIAKCISSQNRPQSQK